MAYSFEYDAGDTAFRDGIRAFLDEHLPRDMADRKRTAVHTLREDFLGWQGILSKRGWSVPHWRVEYGGTGWSAKRRLIFEEECMVAGAPPPNSQAIFMLAPIIQAFGTAEQKERFLPDIRERKILWPQGFSEPNAGSDRASLKTRAVPHGDGWIVDGQKIWTSLAHIADWIFLLVKTDTAVKAQAGISFMVVSRHAPGVTVRPIAGSMAMSRCARPSTTTSSSRPKTSSAGLAAAGTMRNTCLRTNGSAVPMRRAPSST